MHIFSENFSLYIQNLSLFDVEIYKFSLKVFRFCNSLVGSGVPDGRAMGGDIWTAHISSTGDASILYGTAAASIQYSTAAAITL